MSAHKVFISHAFRDPRHLRKLMGELRSKGVVDPSDEIIDISAAVDTGGSVRGQVRKAIESASKVIVVWGEGDADSEWVNYESGMADALEKPIIIVIPKGQKSRIPTQLIENTVLELENVD